VLDALAPDDECVQEEIFGPVLAVQVFDSLDEAIALADGTRYALVAGVFTRDFTAAHRLARDIDAGQVYVNEYFAGGIEVPFGGNRSSGFGREKGLGVLRSYCLAIRRQPQTMMVDRGLCFWPSSIFGKALHHRRA